MAFSGCGRGVQFAARGHLRQDFFQMAAREERAIKQDKMKLFSSDVGPFRWPATSQSMIRGGVGKREAGNAGAERRENAMERSFRSEAIRKAMRGRSLQRALRRFLPSPAACSRQ